MATEHDGGGDTTELDARAILARANSGTAREIMREVYRLAHCDHSGPVPKRFPHCGLCGAYRLDDGTWHYSKHLAALRALWGADCPASGRGADCPASGRAAE